LEAVLHSYLATIYSLFQRPDIVHIHNIGPALFSPILKLAGIKVVLTYHSPNYEHKKWNFLARKLLKLSEKIALATSDAIIFISEFQRNKYSPKIQAKSCYIPNGIQAPDFTEETHFLQALGLQKNKYILTVGRITPEKGFDYLVKAFEKAAIKDYKLVIAGGVEQEHTYFADLKKHVSSGQIIFTGFVFGNKLAQLYSHAALFILPSYSEGLPLVLLEAMSYHLNILASDIPANKALNLPDSSYFTTGNEEELSARLQQAIREDMPPRIRYHSTDHYNWNRIAGQTEAVYNSVAMRPKD
jgi:glycosyltransferase involved in cell wall biosynthesis